MRRSRKQLREAQVLAYKFIKRVPKCAIFGDIGIGKCGAALTALVDLREDCSVVRTLVIGPKNVVVATWPQEIRIWKHASHLTYEVLHGCEPGNICEDVNGERRIRLWEKKVARYTEDYADAVAKNNYEPEAEVEVIRAAKKLSWAKRVLRWGYCSARRPAEIHLINRENFYWLVLFWGKYWPYDTVIYDESADLKNGRKVKRWQAMRKIMPYVDRLIEMTGTPAPKGQIDLWGQIYLLDAGQRLGRTLTKFRSKFFSKEDYSYVYEVRDDDEIPRRIRDVAITLEAKDFMDLPPTIFNQLPVVLDDSQMEKYHKFEKSFVMELEGAEIEAVNAAVLQGKLLQLANGVVYDAEKNHRVFHHAKLDALSDYISEMQHQPFLLAYYYKHDLQRILKRFKKIEVFTVDKIKKWNKGKIEIMAVHPGSVGEGMNIQYGSRHMLWYGPIPSQDLKMWQQLNGRIEGARAVGLGSAIIGCLVAQGTKDELVVDALQGKAGAQAAFRSALKRLIAELN